MPDNDWNSYATINSITYIGCVKWRLRRKRFRSQEMRRQDSELGLVRTPETFSHVCSRYRAALFFCAADFASKIRTSIYNHVVLASLQGDYHIHLKPEATPFALPPPCNVLLSMRQEVKAELECTAPTYGSSTQPNVAVCIVYLRPLNTGII